MNPNQALWEKGDFTQIAAFMRQSGEAVVASLGIAPPVRVLDLGCGDGTTALPLARAGADVRGIDIAHNLVEAGTRRAAEAGLSRTLTFEVGDACKLEGVADDAFDLTLTVFGAMFAPKPFDVANEMVRVTKPGGRIVMGNWIPNDPTFVSQVLKISSGSTPPPPRRHPTPAPTRRTPLWRRRPLPRGRGSGGEGPGGEVSGGEGSELPVGQLPVAAAGGSSIGSGD